MKTRASELKAKAKRSLMGKYGICVGANLIVGLLFLTIMMTMAFFMSFSIAPRYRLYEYYDLGVFLVFIVLYLVVMSVLMLFATGLKKLYMNICTGRPEGLSDLLFVFSRNPLKYLGLYFFRLLLGFILSIPYWVVMVAGMVTHQIPVMVFLQVLMYVFLLFGTVFLQLYLSQAELLLLDNPDKKVFLCIRESIAMMNGNKGRMFYLYLSFIGMVLLCYITAGIALLWVLPYITCTMVHFYLDLKRGNSFEQLI